MAADAEPDLPKPPSITGFVRQVAVLPAIWLSGKIDWDNAENKQYLVLTFGCVMSLLFALTMITSSRVRAKNDSARVKNPGQSQYLTEDMVASDGSVSVCQYDQAKLQEAKLTLLMSAAFSAFMNYQWGYTQPLIMMCTRPTSLPVPALLQTHRPPASRKPTHSISLGVHVAIFFAGVVQPLQLVDNSAIKIHLFGADPTKYPRPWAAANADNPLAKWAEKKKQEAAATDAEAKKKKAE
jgi:hypothetical protein